MTASHLPRVPAYAFTYDYEPFGDGKELIATCPRCGHSQHTGLFVGELVPEPVINRIKDRLRRYHECSGSAFSALAEIAGIEAVMDAFGFPDTLKPDRPQRDRPQRQWGVSREES